MTEEIKTCDFYNDKICNLFTEYFKFKVECKNLSLCAVDDDTERECPYKQLKRLEQENEILKKKLDLAVGRSITNCEAAQKYWAVLEEIKEIAEKELYLKQNSSLTKIIDKINKVLNLS